MRFWIVDREIITQIPWVKVLAKPRRCTALRWSHVPLTKLYGTPEQRAEVQEKYRCKNTARWRFTGLRGMWGARSGCYCWNHLIHHGVYGGMREEDRTERWLRRTHPELLEES